MKNQIARKIMATALAATMLIGSTMTAFANDIEVTETGTRTVTVTTKSGGTGGDGSDEGVFIVKIPASITLSRKEYTTFEGSYKVGVKGVLPDTKSLSVYPNGTGVGANDGSTFTMTGANTSTNITAEAVQKKSYWANQTVYDGRSNTEEYSVIASDDFVDATGTITTTVTVADEYTGTLGFVVALNDVQ